MSSAPRKSLKHAKRPRIHTFIATSDIHLKYKLKKIAAAGARTKPWPPWNWRAATWTTSSSPPKTARAPTRITWKKISKAVVAAGARTVNLPDTVGYSTPEEYGALIGRIVEGAGRYAPSSACTATTIWAWPWPTRWPPSQAGARQIECTINGIGERAGNCSLEEVVMAIKTRARPLPVPHQHRHRASVLRPASC